MYIPHVNLVTEEPPLWQLMREFNFAMLITAPDSLPFVTQVPFVIDESTRRLSTHVAKANPQWQHLEPTREVLIVFQAEHALISSRWYEAAPNVPTWNYATVHAYATPRILEGLEARAQVEALMKHHAHEQDMHNLPEDYVAKMMNGLVPIEFTVTRLEGKFKLSQNKTERDQRNVINELQRQGEQERGVAERMRAGLE
jgi:transcriptional regulator